MDPIFSIANLRAKGELVEIRYPDLIFSNEEADSYFNDRLALHLNKDEVQELVDFTEGWIVGLHLASISLINTNEPANLLSKLSMTSRYITEYLIDEVLRIQSEDIQNFLLKSSNLQRFSVDLCNYVFKISNSRELLDEIERTNLFIIPLDNNMEWYRYHHLFQNRFQIDTTGKIRMLGSKFGTTPASGLKSKDCSKMRWSMHCMQKNIIELQRLSPN